MMAQLKMARAKRSRSTINQRT